MDIIDTAKELGTMIGNSNEMTNLQKTEAVVQVDEKAKTLLEEYKEIQIEMVQAAQEQKEESVIEEIKEKLFLKQEEINNYPVTNDYLEARSAFDKLMKNINDVIIFGMSGEEQCAPSKCGSCGGSCSSCK